MTDEEKAAKEAESAAAKKGANDGSAPTPEQLRAAQDSAEKNRKEAEEAKEELEEKQKELDDLNEKAKLSQSEKERKAKLELGISDDEALVAELEGMAAKGDATARAYLAAMEKRARKIAQEEISKHMTAAQLERDFDTRDEWVEQKVEEWNKGKSADESISVEKFKEMIGSFSDPSLRGNPSKQAKQAYVLFLREQNLKEREAKIKELEIKNGQFRDTGTSKDKEGDKTTKKSWRDAKTPQEKEAQLATL